MANNSFAVAASLLFQIVGVVDAEGDPAALATPIAWKSSDSTILNPIASSDGMTATATALKTGNVMVSATDANGVTSSVAVTVTAGQAVSFTIQVSQVVANPAPPPNSPAAS